MSTPTTVHRAKLNSNEVENIIDEIYKSRSPIKSEAEIARKCIESFGALYEENVKKRASAIQS